MWSAIITLKGHDTEKESSVPKYNQTPIYLYILHKIKRKILISKSSVLDIFLLRFVEFKSTGRNRQAASVAVVFILHRLINGR